MNSKLWTVHSTRHMAFGYPTPVAQAEHDIGNLPQPLSAPGFTVLDDEQMANSNWRKKGTLKFPAYGKMYDMQTILGSNGAGIPANTRIEVPRDMNRNDVRNESMRFVLFFCDGHGNLSGPDGDVKTKKQQSGLQLQMSIEMHTKYTASAGPQL